MATLKKDAQIFAYPKLSSDMRDAGRSASPPATSSGHYDGIMGRFFTEDRVALLHDIPPHIVKKAWFTMSHALLNMGAVVLDAGCRTGDMTYVMAVLYPEVQFVGVDINADLVRDAQKKFQRPNLRYEVADIYKDLQDNSFDLIVDSFFLHEVYSARRYNENSIRLALEQQYKALRPGGYLIIRDHFSPTPGAYVKMEFTDKSGQVNADPNNIEGMSEADLLVWFSDHARAKSDESEGTFGSGFFLEELAPNFPQTRLFRIPEKWAHEFVIRRDNRAKLVDELSKEYAFFTESEFRKVLRGFGARVAYSAPHWDEGFIKTRYTGALRMYNENGAKMGPPPTNHILVAQKVAENTSQVVLERRTSRARTGAVYLRTVRDEHSGALTDIICRDLEIAEILPFRVTPNNKLKIYLHEGIPRGLANSVPRSGVNLDGRKWSGHMTEAIALPSSEVEPYLQSSMVELQKFSVDAIGIKPSLDAKLMAGGGFYPDPTHIDERILTYYMRVEDYHYPFEAKHTLHDVEGFSSKGQVRELDAQAVLNAIAVGYLPSSRLEAQILGLYQMLGIKAETWSDMPLRLSEIPVEDVAKITDILKQYRQTDDRFKPVRGSAGNIKLVQSVFVDEGRDQGGGISGLAARDLEFAVPENNTINTAVVMPLVRNLNGEVMAGIVTQYLPVPQRYSGTGHTVSLPSFPLPKEVTDIDAARHFVAEQFKVKPEFVARMGESFFTHIGVTPHRVYPFVVTDTRWAYKGTTHGVVQLTPLKDLWKMLYWDNHDSFLKIAGMAYQNLIDSDLTLKHDFEFKLSASAGQPVMHNASMISVDGSASSTPAVVSAAPVSASGSSFSSAFSTMQEEHKQEETKRGETGKGGKASSALGGPNDDVMGQDFRSDREKRGFFSGLFRAPKTPS
ncbi:MAG: methyltransferase domain-containing protein [Pseudobdellovibrionaceae bacterium]